jgi:predicted phage terminase large subunit-like protein
MPTSLTTKLTTSSAVALVRNSRLDGVRAEKCRRSLFEFTRAAWNIVDPAMPFRDNWHVGAICESLEAVAKFQITQLVINIPPGFAKSILACVMFPAWQWARDPKEQMIFASYSDVLAKRDSMRTRDLINSEWYQRSFVEDRWSIKTDRNRQDWFETTQTGRRQCTSVGGGGTGLRGNLVVVDDPINALDAHSEAARDEAIRWWDGTMPSRVNDPMRAAWVIIMQRLHEQDLTGHVLAKGKEDESVRYEHLCLPMRYESDRKCTVYVKRDGVREELLHDPRTEEGELLFPALYPDEAVRRLETKLGAQASGQLQQSPSPSDGGMFKIGHWRFWKPDGTGPILSLVKRPRGWYDGPARPLPKMEKTVISLDANFKEGKKNDYVVFTVWGTHRADRYLLDMRRGRVDFQTTLAWFRELVRKYPGAYAKYVEDKANGSAVINTLSKEIAGIIAVTPEGGKESRAAAIQPQVQSGNVYLPDGAPWIEEFVEEFKKFPNGANDDMVDSTSQALIALMGSLDAARFLQLAGH